MGKILVTGGAGYIGSVVTSLLAERGREPLVFDNLSQGHLDSLPEGTPVVVGDLQDKAALEDLFSRNSVDGVIHLAAVSMIQDSVAQPLRYYRENVAGLLNLLLAMRVAGVGRLVFSSTAAVYGIPAEIPVTEKSALNPISPFGWSKLACEQILMDTAGAHGLRCVSLRFFNVAGATAHCGEDHRPEPHLIPRILEIALGRRSHVEIYGTDYDTPDGTCVRDYLHVLDLAEAHVAALDSPRASGTYSVGSNHGYSVREVIRTAEKVLGQKVPAREMPRRPGDPPRLVASHDRLRAELGWEPRHRLEEMFSSAWDWRRRNPDGYAR